MIKKKTKKLKNYNKNIKKNKIRGGSYMGIVKPSKPFHYDIPEGHIILNVDMWKELRIDRYTITSVTIPKGVTTIGVELFLNCFYNTGGNARYCYCNTKRCF